MSEAKGRNYEPVTLKERWREAVYQGRQLGIAGAIGFGIAGAAMSGAAALLGSGDLAADYYSDYVDEGLEDNFSIGAIDAGSTHIIIIEPKDDTKKLMLFSAAASEGSYIRMKFEPDYREALKILKITEQSIGEKEVEFYNPKFVSLPYEEQGDIYRVIPDKGYVHEPESWIAERSEVLVLSAIESLSEADSVKQYGMSEKQIEQAHNNTKPQKEWGDNMGEHAILSAKMALASFVVLGAMGFIFGGSFASAINDFRRDINSSLTGPKP